MAGTAQDQDQGRIVASGEGQAYDVMGATIRARLDTRGFSVIDDQEAAGGGGVPVHRHRDHDELLYVIEGEVTFKIGEQLTRGTAGTLAYAPRGVEHTYRSEGPARLLVVWNGGGYTGLFKELAGLPPGPPDMSQVGPMAQKYGMEITGPPLGH